MIINIFAKKHTTKEGKMFRTYLTRLHNKRTGKDETFNVKFRESCNFNNVDCPCSIRIDLKKCNMVKDTYLTTEGQEVESRILWVTSIDEILEFVDDSLNDYM